MTPAPIKPGFYWAIHRLDDDDSSEPNEGFPQNKEWEVMHVVVNAEPSDPEYLMVMVPGITKWQPLDAFVWGEECYRTGGREALAYLRAAEALATAVSAFIHGGTYTFRIREAWSAFDRARIAWKGRPT